jgi:hypothetical protein
MAMALHTQAERASEADYSKWQRHQRHGDARLVLAGFLVGAGYRFVVWIAGVAVTRIGEHFVSTQIW